MNNKVIITQSNYIPWKGYFTTMKKASHFIIYDDAQYTKRDWRNRNKIVTPNGLKWLSIPVDVKGKYHQKINEAKISDPNWTTDHWNKIYQNYKKAPCFKQISSHFEELYLDKLRHLESLTDINRTILEKCIELLEIEIKIMDSRDFNLRGGKTEKLINLCKDLEADEYFTGSAAKNYIEEDLFFNSGVKLSYYDLDGFPIYEQQWDDFEHKVSILDMFFNLGFESKNYFN